MKKIKLIIITAFMMFGFSVYAEAEKEQGGEHENYLKIQYPFQYCFPDYATQIVACIVHKDFLRDKVCPEVLDKEVPKEK